jgi:hypothetical protein
MPGFIRGYTPSIMRSSLILGTYFSNLYYFETLFKKSDMFPAQVVAGLSSASARALQTVLYNPLIVI